MLTLLSKNCAMNDSRLKDKKSPYSSWLIFCQIMSSLAGIV